MLENQLSPAPHVIFLSAEYCHAVDLALLQTTGSALCPRLHICCKNPKK